MLATKKIRTNFNHKLTFRPLEALIMAIPQEICATENK